MWLVKSEHFYPFITLFCWCFRHCLKPLFQVSCRVRFWILHRFWNLLDCTSTCFVDKYLFLEFLKVDYHLHDGVGVLIDLQKIHTVLSKIFIEIIQLLFIVEVLHVNMQIFFLCLNINFMDLLCFMCVFIFFRKLILILFEEGPLVFVELRRKDHLDYSRVNFDTSFAFHFHFHEQFIN